MFIDLCSVLKLVEMREANLLNENLVLLLTLIWHRNSCRLLQVKCFDSHANRLIHAFILHL